MGALAGILNSGGNKGKNCVETVTDNGHNANE